MALTVDCERLAGQLIRTLRGKRSRPGFSRHLGYASNVVQRWETGEHRPTATAFFELCARLRIDVRARLLQFLRGEPRWLELEHFDAARAVPSLLGELIGRARLSQVAAAAGYNRYSLGRWWRARRRRSFRSFCGSSKRRAA
ncbi:MAG TPA: helix-turn-helix transcriptional regulator, partial [Polyangiaceae bacterium]|nr:helix-turn-helix transcriptional regulator [Polyangiaceae bacterium]